MSFLVGALGGAAGLGGAGGAMSGAASVLGSVGSSLVNAVQGAAAAEKTARQQGAMYTANQDLARRFQGQQQFSLANSTMKRIPIQLREGQANAQMIANGMDGISQMHRAYGSSAYK